MCYFKSPVECAFQPKENEKVYNESQNFVLSTRNSPFFFLIIVSFIFYEIFFEKSNSRSHTLLEQTHSFGEQELKLVS